MTLSAEAIADFKEIYTRQFGEQLMDAEAESKAIAMLKLFRLIYSEVAPQGWQGDGGLVSSKRKYGKN